MISAYLFKILRLVLIQNAKLTSQILAFGIRMKKHSKITVEEVKKGFLANPNLTIRTEQISENGQKTLLSRDEAIYKIDDATELLKGKFDS